MGGVTVCDTAPFLEVIFKHSTIRSRRIVSMAFEAGQK